MSICRHCQVRIKRVEYPDGTALWVHTNGSEEYWHCRTTTAGPQVSLTDGLVPDCPDHEETQHRDGKPPWCNRCGWRHGQPARPASAAVKVVDR